MNKRELRKLPIPDLFIDDEIQEILERCKDDTPEKVFPAAAKLHRMDGTDVLQLCLCECEETGWTWFIRSFYWYEGGQPMRATLTRDLHGKRKQEYRWKSNGIANDCFFVNFPEWQSFRTSTHYYYSDSYYFANAESRNAVTEFLKVQNSLKHGTYYDLESFEDAAAREESKRRSEKKAEKINRQSLDAMGEFPELPDDFSEFMSHAANAHRHRLFYKPGSSAYTEVYCTHCNQVSKVRRDEVHPKLFRIGTCPACGRKSYFATESRFSNWSRKTKEHPLAAAICQPAIRKDGRRGFVIRYFGSSACLFDREKTGYRKMDENHYEVFRQVVLEPAHPGENIEIKEFDYFYYGQTGIQIWRPNRYWGQYFGYSRENCCYFELDHSGTILYTKNLETALARTDYKGAAKVWKENAERAGMNGILMYSEIYKYTWNRVYEFFRAMHMDRMAYSLEHKDFLPGCHATATRPEKVLGVSRDIFLSAKRMNLDWDELDTLKDAEKDGIKIHSREELAVIKLLKSERNESITNAIRAIGTKKLARYFQKGHTVDTWCSLAKMVGQLKYPMDDYYLLPKNIDEVVTKLKASVLQRMQYRYADSYASLNAELERLKRFRFVTDGSRGKRFEFKFPGSVDELVREGAVLHHCVGTPFYAQGMQRHETMIFFIRDTSAPDEPLATMEWNIKTHRITQCKILGDYEMQKNHPAFKAMHHFADYLRAEYGECNPWDHFLKQYPANGILSKATVHDAVSEFCYRAGLSAEMQRFSAVSDSDLAEIAKMVDPEHLSSICGCAKVSENDDWQNSGKYRLLWHGTKTENWKSIVKDGLKIFDADSGVYGRRFGDGIYFSNHFDISAGHCSHRNTGVIGLYAVPDNSVSIRNKEESVKAAENGADSTDFNNGAEVVLFHPELAKLCYLVEFNTMQ